MRRARHDEPRQACQIPLRILKETIKSAEGTTPFLLGGSRQSRVKMPFSYLGGLREQFNAIERASSRDDLSVRS